MSDLGPSDIPLDDLPEAMRPAFLAAARGDTTWVAQVPPQRPFREWVTLWNAVATMTLADLEKTPPQARADEINTAMVAGFAAALSFLQYRLRTPQVDALRAERDALRAENDVLRTTVAARLATVETQVAARLADLATVKTEVADRVALGRERDQLKAETATLKAQLVGMAQLMATVADALQAVPASDPQ